ncbi:MDR family MFS transporter [Anaerocolumna sp. MB42-C2]|uniref:MDR family MFS transporter n=1 Tax=Anaerocolumna sp. MB42-C2 TaxID=3070997 RepID=UPI0027E15A57|nr:MDR family MFS transporter [Anaerocolumna sp. MB42-C2]WMJ90467.1 MDR family MFS transporter [Anaerocolumna sp. MB42-C2]
MKTKNLSKTKITLILIGLMASLLLSALDSTIVGTAMKKMVNDLQGMEYYAWPFTIYMLCATVITPISGGLADIFGRKPLFVIGILTFLSGSALCGMSQSMIQLIIFRGIQGIGGGIVVTSVFTVVADLFPPAKRGKYMGMVASMYGLSSLIGPLLGGLIIDNLSWRWIFYINIPVGILAVTIISFIMPDFKSEERRNSVDYSGTFAMILALVPMLLAFSWGGKKYPWISVQIIGMFIFSFIMLGIFVYCESKAQIPIIPLSFFKNRNISVTLIVAFLTNGIMFAAIMYIPYFAQGIIGTTATTSGSITMPMMLGLLLASSLTGVLISKTGKSKIFVFTAFGLMTIGTGLLSTMSADTPYFNVIFYMIILGLGIGINMPIANTNIQNSVPQRQIGSATSTVQFSRNIGSTIGSAIYGTIMSAAMNMGFEKLDLSNIPSNIQEILKNPQVITNSESVNQIVQHTPTQYSSFLITALEEAKKVLSSSIHEIFFFCMFVAIGGFVLTIIFKDAPVRTRESGKKNEEIV